jgi:hypothetical protein
MLGSVKAHEIDTKRASRIALPGHESVKSNKTPGTPDQHGVEKIVSRSNTRQTFCQVFLKTMFSPKAAVHSAVADA